ncbi:MAG TPA: PDZ domain-containing protein [Blastocatellia bacterium]|nr:PDZ domain-containing protein [Blastocatellia bacterium]
MKRLALVIAIRFLVAASILTNVASMPAPGYWPQINQALRQRASGLGLTYTLSFPQPHTHLYEVTFSISNVTTPQLDLQMPTWTPGSYLQREFARNVQDFAARDDAGRELKWEKTDKATWRIEAGGSSTKPQAVQVFYRVYANELSVRTSHLDASHAYFNGASVFMYVRGATNQPLRLKINAPAGWRVTTPLALAPDKDGYYSAPNYDILVDSPTEIGTHRLIEFDVRGRHHRVAIWGDGNYDEARLKEDLPKIVEQGARLFGGLPYEHYTFIIHLQPNIGGGLEHLNSTTLETRPNAFKPRRNYVGFLGLAAHEYFHLWNVKRIRPQALGPFDYQHENYTRALWVSEGFTDYYAGQLLRRAGLITSEEYLEEFAREIMNYEQTPGREHQSAEESSFDAWIKFYRPDENSPNATISYYNKGSLLGFLFDFEIRTRTKNAKTLDDVMRYLYENYAQRGVGFPENELKGVFEKIAGGDLTDFWKRYVSGTAEINFDSYLRRAGLKLEKKYQPTPFDDTGDKEKKNEQKDEPPRGDLGMRTNATGDRVFVATVLEGLPAYKGGINSGDELIAINGERITAANLAERMSRLKPNDSVSVVVARRERLVTFNLTAAQKPFDRYVITPVKDATAEQRALQRAWLGEELKSDAESK